ncbi:MAG: two-component sensor histidine kinase [Lachnospiraceae bacterium]|nr:two-component sensor histidine kinase [Lachnospiraceae bacterium]
MFKNFKVKGKFFRSLNFRIMLFLFLFGTLSAALTAVVLRVFYERQALTQLADEVRNQCQILSTQIVSADYLHEPENEILAGDISQVATLYDGRIILIDDNLVIVEDTYDFEESLTMVAENVIKCFRGETVEDYVSGRYIQITVPITWTEGEETTIVGVILARASTDNIYIRLDEFEFSAQICVLVIAFCSLFLAILLSRLLVKPLRHMNQYIGDMLDGMLEDNMNIHDCTEVEMISDSFNLMLAKLRVMEESRQEFVSNVSHELKTPLASMKVLADSLLAQEDTPRELYQEFMGDIASEIDRENTIISDLLTLVKMDRKTPELNVETVDINEFLEQILKRLRPIAEKENIEVVFESNRSVSAEIDPTRLSLAFTNLVENAIKYNRNGGWVRVTLDADHKFFYVKVSDSGIGIPQESLDYVFERFYRVDKSHSREIGGTGLGLAITKSAVVAHRGAIKVQSTVDEGTTFTVRIPLKYIV